MAARYQIMELGRIKNSIMRIIEVAAVSAVLYSGPPYYDMDKPLVKNIQNKLQDLGYSVGPTGIDGKYGPYTAKAISNWRDDYKIAGTPDVLDLEDQEKLLRTKPKVRSAEVTPIKRDTKTTKYSFRTASLEDARKSAEEYLGRDMSDKEWNYLVRATIAESSPNTKEQGYVMAVILNRAREGYKGDTNIIDILKQPYQFQAVTGTRYDKGPSKNFSKTPTESEIKSIANAATAVLPKANKTFLNFTSANPKAYGKGTNIDFLRAMIDAGGVKIGQSVFGSV